MASHKQFNSRSGSITLPVSLSYFSDRLHFNPSRLFLAITVFFILSISVGLAPALSVAAPPAHANATDVTTLGKENRSHQNTESFARGRILVEPRAGLPVKAFAGILQEHHGKARKIGQSNLYIVDVPPYSEEGIVARLEHHPYLKFAELDYAVSSSFIPDDPYYLDAWHLPKIAAPAAWDNSQGNGVTIAILDSGVNDQHPDLAAQLVPGWNVYDDIADTTDNNGHGTWVAGTAAASTNNGIGVAGVASQSKIMPIVITPAGFSSTFSSYVAEGLIYAADHGARVANVSYRNQTNYLITRNAAQYMKDKNGLVFVSAGNTGVLENFTVTSTMIPASATDQNDLKTSFSSYGDYVAMAAPGSFIWSTDKDGGYSQVQGTSFSSPITAGVVAMMMAANPTLSSIEIENLLFSTAVDLGDPGRDPYYGHGRVNAAAAVQAAAAAIPSVDTEAPTASLIEPLDGATVAGLVPVDIEASDNVAVTNVELRVNNTTVAVDTSTPFAFTWDSSGAPNGVTNLVARVFDAAGNMASSTVVVNVDNQAEPIPVVDSEPPIVNIINPVEGNVKGNVTISVDASDDSGASGISLSIYTDDMLVATGTGSTLATNWNTRPKRVNAGTHTIKAVAKDAAGNTSSTSVNVNVNKK